MLSKIVKGDCRSVLRKIANDRIDAVITDPPYEIGMAGHAWDRQGAAFDPEIWGEICRVLKPGGAVLAFGSPRKIHRVTCAIEDAGIEIRDQLEWIRGGASMPKGGWVDAAIDRYLGVARKVVGERILTGNAAMTTAEKGGTYSVGVDSRGRRKTVPVTAPGSSLAEKWQGWGWNLAPGHEPIVLARKPFSGSAVGNLVTNGVGALNLRGCSVSRGGGTSSLPRNVVFTHTLACTPDRCAPWCPVARLGAQSGRTRAAGNKKPTTGRGALWGSTGARSFAVSDVAKGDEGTAARYFPSFFYVVKTSRREKTIGGLVHDGAGFVSVKPVELLRYLAKMVTPPGGVILDPFAGSGSMGIAAHLEGFRFLGVEKDPKTADLARRRISAAKEGGFFDIE